MGDRRPRRWQALALVATAVVGLGACSSPAPRPPGPVPPVPATVEVDMREYAFTNPSVVARGRVLLVAHNRGRLRHRLSLFPLPEDFPPILEQVRGSHRRVAEPLAATPGYGPGSSGAVAVDLPPGRYGLVCFVVDRDGRSHGSKGMASEFRVQ